MWKFKFQGVKREGIGDGCGGNDMSGKGGKDGGKFTLEDLSKMSGSTGVAVGRGALSERPSS